MAAPAPSDGTVAPPNSPRFFTSIAHPRLLNPPAFRLDAAPNYSRVFTSAAHPHSPQRHRGDLSPHLHQLIASLQQLITSLRRGGDPEAFRSDLLRAFPPLYSSLAPQYDPNRPHLGLPADFFDKRPPTLYREGALVNEATLVSNVPSCNEPATDNTSALHRQVPGDFFDMDRGSDSLAGYTLIAPYDILYSTEALREKASWIRDVLEDKISHYGPDVLLPGERFMVNDFLFKLERHSYTAEDLRLSSIHKAITTIAGTGTRWPPQIVGVCDDLIEKWQKEYGELKDLTPILWEGKGRLEGIVPPDFTKEKDILTSWLNSNTGKTGHHYAHRLGHIGLTPGDWWLDPTLAYYDGVITLNTLRGGIVADYNTVYAVVLRDDAEVHSPDPNIIRFRCDMLAWGRRQMSNNHRHLRTIRVFRDHALKSLYAPISGFRYEGLYRIFASYTKSDNSRAVSERYSLSIMQQFTLVREPQSSLEPPVEQILKRPNAAERDEMAEFKRVMWANRKMPAGLSLEEANALRFPAASK